MDASTEDTRKLLERLERKYKADQIDAETYQDIKERWTSKPHPGAVTTLPQYNSYINKWVYDNQRKAIGRVKQVTIQQPTGVPVAEVDNPKIGFKTDIPISELREYQGYLFSSKSLEELVSIKPPLPPPGVPTMVCEKCNSPIPQDATRCPNCGAAISYNCPYCRAGVVSRGRFCPNCDAYLDYKVPRFS